MLPLVLFALAAIALAAPQTPQPVAPAEPAVVLTQLAPLSYPPLARQARIAGDVEIEVRVGKDGAIQLATAITGHPMLQQTALDSARQSHFECRKCLQDTTTARLVYTFKLSDYLEECFPRRPATFSGNHVTITAGATRVIVDYSNIAVRSAKCAYLWRCGSEWGGMQDNYDRVRSLKCLDLWQCAWRRRVPVETISCPAEPS